MPRKVPRTRPYDVPFIGAGIATIELQPRQIDVIRRALRKEPSKDFLGDFEVALSDYERHQEAVRNSTPAAVQARIRAVVVAAEQLRQALTKLTHTDALLFMSISTEQFLRKQESLSLQRFEGSLPHFLTVATGALRRIEGEKKAGAMPAFAQRGLALAVCHILSKEIGKPPTTEKSGAFDTLLRFGLDLVDDRERAAGRRDRKNKRKDVADLMRDALRWSAAPTHESEPFARPPFSLSKSPRRE